MKTKELMSIVADRGLRLKLSDGRPILVKPANYEGNIDKLLAVLKFHRESIISILSQEKSA